MRHLISAIFIVILLISPSCKFMKGKGLFGGKKAALAAMQAKQDSIRIADSIRVIQDRLLAIEQAKADSLNRLEAERAALDSKFRYNIIVGSFITPAYARDLAEEYRKMGYDPKIFPLTGTKFELVSAEGHDNFTKAVERLSQFQDTVALDSWLYIKK
jgi:hypothetical protein